MCKAYEKLKKMVHAKLFMTTFMFLIILAIKILAILAKARSVLNEDLCPALIFFNFIKKNEVIIFKIDIFRLI